ncbi:hypothetical protein [Ruegeria sp. HKCCD7255]|uniref:hypothetical protein n=1 Tax=Ruegeria sp. HKCCD7255 TaxID=2683004 RepID=UPI0014876EDE|nr:hypothetical protein [Ruegeria sp. HKCCD7255]
MAHAPCVPHKPIIQQSLVFAVFLTGAAGFALGQNWPLDMASQDAAATQEDWHGNVRRSSWGQSE